MPLGATITACQAKQNVARMANQFIPELTAAIVVKEARKLWTEGQTVTIDPIGERTGVNSEPDGLPLRLVNCPLASVKSRSCGQLA